MGENNKPRPPLISESETQELLRKTAQGDDRAREKLVDSHMRLVYKIGQRFSNRGKEMEDIFQVGSIGLIKAIDKFDPSFSVCFSTYAVPMIMGEIRRFLRDDNSIHVSRSLKENARKLLRIKEELSQSLNREPTLNELVQASQMNQEEIILALDSLAEPLSLNEQVFRDDHNQTLQDQIKDDGNTEENWLERLAIQEAISYLKERERQVVELRYFQAKTQSETATEIGISQAQVSRLEKEALGKIRKLI